MKSCRYDNASEVVRYAVRRIEEEEARESIRRLVQKRLESAGMAGAVEYAGRDGLRQLASGVKARGRKRLDEMRVPSQSRTPR